jgi:hypothetical protein
MSFDPRIIEMMHAMIDGVIAEREKSELLDFLDRNPDAREHFEDLKRISRMIESSERVPPPAQLRERVMAAIRPSVSAKRRVAPRGGGMILRYAYAAAAGLVLGALTYHFISGSDIGRTAIRSTEAAGSMITVPVGEEQAAYREIELDLPGGWCAVMREPMEDRAAVLIELDSPSAIEVQLTWETELARFRGLNQELGQVLSLEVVGGAVSWMQHGHNRVAVALDLPGKAPATFELQLSSKGEPVHHAVLSLSVPEPSGLDSKGSR